jgi:acetyl esterase/lipase
MKSTALTFAVAVVLLLSGALPLTCAPAPAIPLWPGLAPGDQGGLGEEKDLTKPTDGRIADKPVIRLGNVSTPTLTVYPPPAGKANGAAVMVFPGGAYNILAMDLEGTEVCDWLNSIGVTGLLVKYRVPKRAGLDKHTAALQDAQRALSLARRRAAEFGLDPQRLGVLGFSAGGHLAAALCAGAAQRTYPALDAADAVSCQPDFAVLIYPAYLTLKDKNDQIAPDVQVTSQTPPSFLAMAADDPVRVENALYYALALKTAGVPFELHVYPAGGHGYGLRRTQQPITSWPDRAADWMRSRGWLRR